MRFIHQHVDIFVNKPLVLNVVKLNILCINSEKYCTENTDLFKYDVQLRTQFSQNSKSTQSTLISNVRRSTKIPHVYLCTPRIGQNPLLLF